MALLFYPLSTGFIAAQTPVGQTYNFAQPQLIAKMKQKVFSCRMHTSQANDYVYVNDYSDITGTPILKGGGIVNQNAVEEAVGAPCLGAVRSNVVFPTTRIFDYNIWNDLQGGCYSIVSMNGNNGSQGPILCYNRIWKAKKNATVLQPKLFASGGPGTDTLTYNTGELYVLL